MFRRVESFAAILAVVALCDCGPRAALDVGRDLFSSTSVSSAPPNRFTCATCHEIVSNPTKLRPGYTLFDAAVRPSYWGATIETLLEATNECLVQFMRSKPFDASDENGRALFVYLQSEAPDPSSPALPLTVVQNIVDVPSGDATAGESLFRNSCGVCHGDPHTGAGRISTEASIVPDASLQSFGSDPVKGARPVVIEKVQHGKFFNISGTMPLFSLEALSDVQLGDILAYLEGFGLPPSASP